MTLALIPGHLGTPFVTARRNFPTDTDGANRIWLAGGYAPTTATNSMEIFTLPNANANSDSDGHADSDTNGNSNSDTNGNTDSYTNGYTDSYTNGYTDSYANSYTDA